MKVSYSTGSGIYWIAIQRNRTQVMHFRKLRVLSHLVRLPGPNLSSITPPSPCPRWTAFILFYLGPNCGSFASSSQQLFTPLLSNDGAGEGGKLHKIALCSFIYLRFWTVRFVYKASVHKALTSVLRMYCKGSKERWKRTEIRHTAFCLQRVSHARQESEWNTQKQTFLSNNTALIAVHFHDLVRLRSHQQQTVPEFTWTVPQTTLFKWTRVWFVGAHPRSEDIVHIIQTNWTLTSIRPGCAPKVLVWKHPKCSSTLVHKRWLINMLKYILNI